MSRIIVTVERLTDKANTFKNLKKLTELNPVNFYKAIADGLPVVDLDI